MGAANRVRQAAGGGAGMPSTVSWPDWQQQAGRGGDWIRATLINYLPANLLFFTCEIKPSSGEQMPLQDNAIERSLCPAMALSQVKNVS